jgi:hypothetical protein
MERTAHPSTTTIQNLSINLAIIDYKNLPSINADIAIVEISFKTI